MLAHLIILNYLVDHLCLLLSLAYFLGFSKVYLIGHDAWTIPSYNIRFS